VGCGFKSLSAELPFAGDKLRADVDYYNHSRFWLVGSRFPRKILSNGKR
jgi:hypothetical protein